MTLPTFLVIGAMKAGTTSLYEYLRRHPDVFMPATKELDFFVAEKEWQRGLDWYRSQFDGAGGALAVGEACTNYSKFPLFSGVPERIASIVPDVRLVYLVRHPVARMRSEYLHHLSAGWERRPADRALLAKPEYLDNSRYAMQIEQYLQVFPRDQLLVVAAEELRQDRDRTLARVLSFIGARPSSGGDVEVGTEFHATADRDFPRRAAVVDRLPGRQLARRLAPDPLRRAWHRLTALDHPARVELSPEIEREIVRRLAPDVARLRSLLGPDFDGWGLA